MSIQVSELEAFASEVEAVAVEVVKDDQVGMEQAREIAAKELGSIIKMIAYVQRNRFLAAIPPCPDHGAHCVAYALDWIAQQKLITEAARKLVERLEGPLYAGELDTHTALLLMGLRATLGKGNGDG